MFKKGSITWNKGLKEYSAGYVVSEATRKKIGEANKISLLGKHCSSGTEFKKGHQTWNKGKRLSLEERERLSEISKNQKNRNTKGLVIGRKYWLNKTNPNMVGNKNPNWKGGMNIKKNCLWCGGQFRVYPYRKSNAKFCSCKCHGSFIMNNKFYQEKLMKMAIKELRKRPTNLEKQMMEIIEKHNLPYKYVGNGKFWIDGKNPDFVNVNGEKKLIEVGCEYWKKRSDGSVENYIKSRSNHFARYGWESFIFIGDKLEEENILKILQNN